MKSFLLSFMSVLTIAVPGLASAAERCHIAWSHYIGWEIAGHIQDSGIADEIGTKHGVDLKYVFLADYVATLEQTAAGSFDAVTSTTIDALGFLSAGGVPAKVIVIGDYSNGNDAVLVKDPSGSIKSPADVKGSEVYLYELTISDYLFERWLALDGDGLEYRDFTVVGTTDGDIANVYAGGPNGMIAVTWNPMVLELEDSVAHTRRLFDSSRIPGEILDAVVARDDASEACKTAIAESWYAGLAIMNGGDDAAKAAIENMAEFASGGSVDDAVGWFEAQLATTEMFYDPADAAAVAHSDALKRATGFVYDFVIERGLLKAPVGIVFPDGTVIGDEGNPMLWFDASYMKAISTQ